MYKICKKGISFVSALILASSLGLGGCLVENDDKLVLDDYEISYNTEFKFISPDKAKYVVLYSINGEAELIPISDYSPKRNGYTYLEVSNYGDSTPFPTNNILQIFSDGEDGKAYDIALRVATTYFDNVYLYEDVITGKPNNLVLEESISNKNNKALKKEVFS